MFVDIKWERFNVIIYEIKLSKLIFFIIFCEVNLNMCVKMKKVFVLLLCYIGFFLFIIWFLGVVVFLVFEVLVFLNLIFFYKKKRRNK